MSVPRVHTHHPSPTVPALVSEGGALAGAQGCPLPMSCGNPRDTRVWVAQCGRDKGNFAQLLHLEKTNVVPGCAALSSWNSSVYFI